jgi:hypothetical protein
MLELQINESRMRMDPSMAVTILPSNDERGNHPAVLFHSMHTMQRMLGTVIDSHSPTTGLTSAERVRIQAGNFAKETKERLLERQKEVARAVLIEQQGSADRPLAVAPRRAAAIQAVHVAHPSWPMNYHNMRSYSFWNGTITLEDGSDWKVSSVFTVMGWGVNDPILVQPNWNYPLFSNYEFTLINQVTGASVGANLTTVGPEYYGMNSHWITSIDYFLGRVYLENGSYWSVAPEDSYLLQTWAAGDHILIGEGSGWIYDSIIINYNQNHYVYAYEF